MPIERFSVRFEIENRVYEGSLSLEDGAVAVAGDVDGKALAGTYDLDGESFAMAIHGVADADLFGPGRAGTALSGTLATDPAHLTGTTGHEHGVDIKATLTRR